MQPVIIALTLISLFNPQMNYPAADWRVVDAHDSGDELLALAATEHPADPVLPIYNMDNKSCYGQIEKRNAVSDIDIAQSGLMFVLQDIFRSEGVPHNLVWLAEVESSLNPNAVSSAGAVGLFQLMPATAERFGLQIYPVDDRKTPDKSAKAAACYLRQLHKEFGAWALALAAYNAGEGRVRRTMRSRNARTFSEVVSHLPAETQKYVPRVMTLMALRDDQSRGVSSAIFMP